MEFETFKDDLESYVYENMDLGDQLADKLNDITEGSWDNRTYHYQPDFVALNVKGKGMGDYSKVSDILSEEDYMAELGRSIQYFFVIENYSILFFIGFCNTQGDISLFILCCNNFYF